MLEGELPEGEEVKGEVFLFSQVSDDIQGDSFRGDEIEDDFTWDHSFRFKGAFILFKDCVYIVWDFNDHLRVSLFRLFNMSINFS